MVFGLKDNYISLDDNQSNTIEENNACSLVLDFSHFYVGFQFDLPKNVRVSTETQWIFSFPVL